MYKLTQPDGFDFYTGTINYRDAIGTIIRITDFDPPEKGACGRGLHASKNANDCFIGSKIPCAAFRVKGIQKIAGDEQKCRYRALKVIEEIHDLDKLFGWNYLEACNPIHPFALKPPNINQKHLDSLEKWDSVGNSVRNSVIDSVWDSVWDSVADSVWASVWASVRASVGASVGDSVWDSVGTSVVDSVAAYIGSLFPRIKNWKYINDDKHGKYPFQPAVNLWKEGFVPSFDGKIWRLHGGAQGEILWHGNT